MGCLATTSAGSQRILAAVLVLRERRNRGEAGFSRRSEETLRLRPPVKRHATSPVARGHFDANASDGARSVVSAAHPIHGDGCVSANVGAVAVENDFVRG